MSSELVGAKIRPRHFLSQLTTEFNARPLHLERAEIIEYSQLPQYVYRGRESIS